jgi:hypothetical protein
MCAKHTSRRSFLGTVGATGATVGLPAVLGKQDELTFEEKIERANRIRQEHNSRDAWKEYLLDRGVMGSSDQYTLGGDDGPSIQRYHDESEIDVEINLTFDVDHSNERTYYAELNWHYHWGGTTTDKTPGWGNQGEIAKSKGEAPKDLVSLSFTSTQWEAVRRYSTSRHVSHEKNTGEGVLFAMHDKDANEYPGYIEDGERYETIPPEETFHAGAFLNPKNDSVWDDRHVQGDYAHIWGGLGISSASVSYPEGVSVGLKYMTNKMEVTSPNDSDLPLKKYESDAKNEGGWGPQFDDR